MRTIQLIIEYDGTAYCGWQRQPNLPTVQGMVEEALAKILGGQKVHLQGAGRTDSGVHALAMPAHFRAETTVPLYGFIAGLNCILPPDVAIVDAIERDETFHAQRDAKRKHYQYRMSDRLPRLAVDHNHLWHVGATLDVAMMEEGAKALVGRHDFSAFASSEDTNPIKVRHVERVDVNRDGHTIIVDVVGDGFLMNMVRNIAGTLADMGKGKIEAGAIADILASKDRQMAGYCAPPHGLFLMSVEY